eukprot:TRINITY_DN69861_c0_g1_i1.p1 TRINITY_DN69861_c0_g1~~TRINITY_DN69861_c0_g1_i1.p1  ORF type:complete len:415 (-),score=85.21 TRINITY_DN69861_c0_g1_i1:64-1308(-)
MPSSMIKKLAGVALLATSALAAELGAAKSILGLKNEAEWRALLQSINRSDPLLKEAGAPYQVKKPFACPAQPDGPAPTSVHRLRPKDVEVIGAIGDSLTAAFGAKATWLIDYTSWLEYRGLAFPIGGEADINTIVTVPNIMKAFSPNLVGASPETTTTKEGPETPKSVLNLARSGARADDLPPYTLEGYRGEVYNWTYRAQEVLGGERFKNAWKVLTIFIGSNNLCWICPCNNCNQKRHETALVKSQIAETLQYLQQNVPRLFVNLMLPIDTSRIFAVKTTGCATILEASCPCGAGNNADWRAQVTQRTEEYQQALYELADQFDTEDMAVVVQPWLRNTYPPTKADGSIDYSYFAPDCFHFSGKAHAAAAVALWDNMISPVGKKDEMWYPGEEINCPSANQLLCTKRNQGTGGC